MNLCIDIGNSFIKLAIFDHGEILHKDVVKKLYVKELNLLREKFRFKNVIVGASGRLPKALMRHLHKNYHLLILDSDTSLPIKIAYETPSTLGRDRIAGMVGANALFKGDANVVIDIGTCITYDLIDEHGTYLGGNISPGVKLRLKSMNDYTARLPLVEKGTLDELIGKNTKQALQNGATLGTLLEIESFIERISEKYSKINIILTGGDAIFFGESINSKIFVKPNLVLFGLNEIMNFNV